MSKLALIAEKLCDKGYSIIPLWPEEKTPMVDKFSVNNPMAFKDFSKYIDAHPNLGIGLLMGGEKKLSAIDFDLKYDVTNTLFDRYKKAAPSSITKKMQVNKTKNNGIHFVLSCDIVEPNQVLASRETTNEEVKATFIKSLGKEKFLDTCLAASNDRTRVLIETRGEGGYIVYPPSLGYTHVYGKINKITFTEYECLMETARSFNEYFSPVKMKGFATDDEEDLIDKFNKENDGLSILTRHGWEIVAENSKDVRLRRPGDSYSKSSALFDKITNTFVVFTTSTIFKTREAYKPFDIMLGLEYNNNFKQFRKDLK